MKHLYSLATLLLATALFTQSSFAQGVYTAVKSGNWHDVGANQIWEPTEPPHNCSNCQIVLSAPGTVVLNTSITISNASQIIVGGGSGPTTLQINNSDPSTGFATSNNIILTNDLTNSTVVVVNGSLINAQNSGVYDGILVAFTMDGVTSSLKEIGEAPAFFQGNSVAAAGSTVQHGDQQTGPSTLSAIGTLPVILTDFSATVDNGAVDLAWTTQLEENSDHFVIQSSTNAGTSWNTVGTVAAHGNSSTPINYTFTDHKPAAGTTEYRLEMVDRDGKYAYSEVKTVRIGLISSVSLYPNPARDYVNVVLNGESSVSANIRLINESGMLLMEKNVTNAGGTTVALAVSSYPQGNYLIIVTGSDGTKQVNKVMISK